MNSYPKIILVKDYFKIHNFYSQMYGIDKTIILIMVGSFYEIYATDSDGPNIIKVSQELNIIYTKKNKSLPISQANPYMMGFPIYTVSNFLEKLIELNYIVIKIDQVTSPPNPERKITGIYSKTTYVDKINDNSIKSNNLVCLVLDKCKDNLIIGISAYDFQIGIGAVYETSSHNNDILLALDDINRFLDKYPAREIIIETNIDSILTMNIKEIYNYLNINENNIYHINIKEHKNIIWQKLLLNKIYKTELNIDIIEKLHLEYWNWGRLSLIILLDYVLSHQNKLVIDLKDPIIFASNEYLYMGNRSLEQLNINKLNTLIDYTKTILGKRFLSNQLSLPLINIEKLNSRYNMIKILIEDKKCYKLITYLEDIYDLDKIIRKIEINIINPQELYNLYLSFYQINQLIKYFIKFNLIEIFKIDNELILNITNILLFIETNFILDKINNINFNNFSEYEYSFYQINIHKELDDIQNNIDICQNFMKYLIDELEKIIESKINLKYNDRDGYYLFLTTKRCSILKKKFINKIQIGNIELDISDLEFNELPKTPNTKINCNKMKELSTNLVNYKILMAKKLKEYFKNDIDLFKNKFIIYLNKWAKKIGFIDFINSGAICAIKNNYSFPLIENKEHSFIKAIELRHPIVEKIKTDTEYIPHNIELENNGILLYGINSSGKSTLMKSIAVNIILAQIGYYVAATEFIYNPYYSLYTRIGNNDNMFRGQSSFLVEMMELMSILKRNNNKTLVVADEIASGSEIKSATIIICYMIETLAKSNTSFITATHLHDIANMECIKKLINVKIKHLKLTYDNINDILIYDRNLLDGQGETFYGLQIAKYLMKNTLFNERTQEILNEYNNMNLKKSKYNSKIYMEKCEVCNSTNNLETHHIIWQKDFNNNLNKFYLQKNNECNLIILCVLCHDKVDKNEIIIDKYKETSIGRKINYSINISPPKKSKYSQELIDFIMQLQKKHSTEPRLVRIKIKEQFNINVSTNTIINFWNLTV